MSDKVITAVVPAIYDADDGVLMATGTMDEDLVSAWIDISGCDSGVQIAATHTTGTSPVGVLRLQSSDSEDPIKLEASDVPDSDIDVPITAPLVGNSTVGANAKTGIFAIQGDAKPGKYVRVVYDFTSGTAALSILAQGQGVRT